MVPLATPLPPAEFIHATCPTPRSSAAEPDRLIVDCVVKYVDPVVGVPIDTVGFVVSAVPPPVDVVLERVTSTLSINGFPAASYAVISIKFDPA